MKHTDILIIGGGSAGFGAAYRSLLCGKYKVTLVEKNEMLGGTSTVGGVNTWEPGVSGAGVHYEIAERLMMSGNGFVGKTVSYADSVRRFAVSDRSDSDYESTLKRFGVAEWEFRRFHFEPKAMSSVMFDLLYEADKGRGNLSLFLSTEFRGVKVKNGRIVSCTVMSPLGEEEIIPKIVIDCSADIVCARSAGCEYAIGEEGREVYDETCAPDKGSDSLNGITQCFKIVPCEDKSQPIIPAEYDDVDLTEWEDFMRNTDCPVSCFNVYPNGGISVNMLPTIEGETLLKYTYDELKHICEARVYSYFRWLWERSDLKGYRISEVFPMLGIRESYRLVGKHVLTFDEIINGGALFYDTDTTVAFADHPVDTHGRSGRLQATGLYGIPYECMIPNEITNMFVACRGASFSHLAASSARLSRTMMAMGEAAGNAACYCIENDMEPENVPKKDIPSFLAKS